MEHTSIQIQGMSCMGCVSSVTKALGRLDGIKDVKVSLETNSADIDYDEAVIDVAAMEAAVELAGYDIVRI